MIWKRRLDEGKITQPIIDFHSLWGCLLLNRRANFSIPRFGNNRHRLHCQYYKIQTTLCFYHVRTPLLVLHPYGKKEPQQGQQDSLLGLGRHCSPPGQLSNDCETTELARGQGQHKGTGPLCHWTG